MPLARVLLILTVGTISVLSLGAAAPPLKQVRTIPLPHVAGRIDHMAIDSADGMLYVAALGNNSVEAVDVHAGAVIGRKSDVREPQGIGIARQHRIIIASGDDGTIRICDSRLRELAKLDGYDDADNVRVDAASHLVYVGFGSGGKSGLLIVDPEKMQRVGEIALPAHPESFQIDPSSKRIWINVPDEKQIIVVDSAKRAMIDRWTLEQRGNFPMALDRARNDVLTVCRRPAKLLVFDARSGKVLQSLDTVGDADDVWVDESGGRVYVAGGEGFIDVFDRPANQPLRRIAQIPTALGARTSLFDAKTRTLYVAVPKSDGHEAELRIFEPQSSPATTGSSDARN